MAKSNRHYAIESKVLFPIIIIQTILLLTFFILPFYLKINQNIVNNNIKRINDIVNITLDLSQHQKRIETNILLYRANPQTYFLNYIQFDRNEITKQINQLKQVSKSTIASEYLSLYIENRNRFVKAGDTLINDIKSGNPQIIENSYDNWLFYNRLNNATLTDLTNYNLQQLDNTSTIFTNLINKMYFIAFCLIGLLFVINVVLYFYYKHIITIPIIKLTDIVEKIRGNHLDVPININSNDEIGLLSGNLKLMVMKIKQFQERLEKKVYKSEQELEKIKTIDVKKDEFISLASHELKTPMTTIKAFTQLLEKYFLNIKDNKALDYLGRMSKQIGRLNNLVDELLDVSRIQAGKMQLNLEVFPFDELIDETVKDFCTIAKEYQIINKNIVKDLVLADRYRLTQVLMNILNNSKKYSPINKKITLSSWSDKKNIFVSIKDGGIGIPRKDLKRIFERFYRVSYDKRNNIPGLGLGMYISKNIILQHKGKIWLESEEGKGTTVYFSVPISLHRALMKDLMN